MKRLIVSAAVLAAALCFTGSARAQNQITINNAGQPQVIASQPQVLTTGCSGAQFVGSSVGYNGLGSQVFVSNGLISNGIGYNGLGFNSLGYGGFGNSLFIGRGFGGRFGGIGVGVGGFGGRGGVAVVGGFGGRGGVAVVGGRIVRR